ncbi:MAG: ABA4-like family protein [Myxococcota bacterium]
MTLESLFAWANYSVIPFWLLLLVAPRWRWTGLLVHGPVVVLLLAPVYAYLLFGYAGTPENIDMTSLYGVVEGFSAPSVAAAGWIHYLIFDLFIGAWEARDAMRRRIPHLAVVPCLLATLLVGPLGLLLYVVVRFIATRILQYDEFAGVAA